MILGYIPIFSVNDFKFGSIDSNTPNDNWDNPGLNLSQFQPGGRSIFFKLVNYFDLDIILTRDRHIDEEIFLCFFFCVFFF